MMIEFQLRVRREGAREPGSGERRDRVLALDLARGAAPRRPIVQVWSIAGGATAPS